MTFVADSRRTFAASGARTCAKGAVRRYDVRVVAGEGSARDAVADALSAADAATTAFQHPLWLASMFATLATAAKAEPFAIVVRAAETSELALVLPVLRQDKGGLSILSFPSFGVSDYGAPVLGPVAPQEPHAAEELWRAVKPALPRADIVRLENMPRRISGRLNPLALLTDVVSSRMSRNAIVVESTVEDLLRARGKKYRKEAERCYRLLAEHGVPEFRRAETADEIRAAYRVLEDQQSERRHAQGGSYLLDRPEYHAFYEDLLRAGTQTGFAHIFTLAAGGETCAALLGIADGESFTALRISTAGGDWKRLSPGRLVILEAMRYFTARGIRTFDMGIGDYAFKHGFGVEAEPLVELRIALSAKGYLALGAHRLKEAARKAAGKHDGFMNLARGMKLFLGG
ncbi:MAG: GNAT family N-acetyltransferase [Hyphomicrobium sp.]|nr:GNAT family N-acetyltransferase [Hyphomicrobium sp.]